MSTVDDLMKSQQGKCHYCGCQMRRSVEGGRGQPDTATIEHLKDKWASRSHIKDESSSNIVAACYSCNHTRGSVSNNIARTYYQKIINQKKLSIQAASTSSGVLFRIFGAVPAECFA